MTRQRVSPPRSDLHVPPLEPDLIPRCTVCRHPITAPESIAAGIGRDCRRKRRALHQEAA